MGVDAGTALVQCQRIMVFPGLALGVCDETGAFSVLQQQVGSKMTRTIDVDQRHRVFI